MVKVAWFVRLEAKPGKEKDVENFLLSGSFNRAGRAGHHGVVRNPFGAVHLRCLRRLPG